MLVPGRARSHRSDRDDAALDDAALDEPLDRSRRRPAAEAAEQEDGTVAERNGGVPDTRAAKLRAAHGAPRVEVVQLGRGRGGLAAGIDAAARDEHASVRQRRGGVGGPRRLQVGDRVETAAAAEDGEREEEGESMHAICLHQRRTRFRRVRGGQLDARRDDPHRPGCRTSIPAASATSPSRRS